MIYTSYFGNIRNLPPGRYYSIARITPNSIPGVYNMTQLAPPQIMLSRLKGGYIRKRDFIIQFSDILSNIEVPKMLYNTDTSDIFLLCYEKSDDFCHRHIVAQWLENNGLECEEYESC